MTTAILWPTFALVGLIFVVLLVLAIKRFGYVKANPPRRNLTSDSEFRDYFRPVDSSAQNLANLFEMPVLYFALVPLLLLFRQADHIEVILAWLFVAFRVAHSLVHIGRRSVPVRFRIYFASCITLSVMWVGFAINMAGALTNPALN